MVRVRTPTSTYRGSELSTLIEERQVKAYLDIEADRKGTAKTRLHGRLVTFTRKVDGSRAESSARSSRTPRSQRSARNQSREWSRLFVEPRVYS